jgi:hypothetical protein
MAPAEMIGDIAAVTVTEVGSNSLFGALASSPTLKRERVLESAGA